MHHEANLRSVVADLPGRMPLRRNMQIVRLADGRLVLYNGIALRDDAMAQLEAWGRPAFLVVPNRFHRLDVAAYKARYPELRVLAPAPARRFVEQVVPVDGGLDSLPADPDLAHEPLAGTRNDEPALIVRSDGRASVIFGDAVFNVPHVAGPYGLVLRLLGSSGGPRVTTVARWLTVRDRAALAAHLERLAGTPGLARVLVSHGAPIVSDAAATLRRVAKRLR